MKYTSVQNIMIFTVSVILGTLGSVQYKSIAKDDNGFEENNKFREIRIMIKGNNDMKQIKDNLENEIQSLRSNESIMKNVNEQIKDARIFSGKNIDKKEALEIIVEGNVTMKYLIDIINAFWNSGAENISLNGLPFTSTNAGLDQAGGQVLLSGTPITTPYMFEIYGDTERLLKILHTETGALKKFITNDVNIIVSVKQ